MVISYNVSLYRPICNGEDADMHFHLNFLNIKR